MKQYTLYEYPDRYRIINNKYEIADRKRPRYFMKSEFPPERIEELIESGDFEVKPSSEYVADWQEKRCCKLEDGGYGTISQQLELLHDKCKELGIIEGIQYWLDHQDTVKANAPKTE